LNYKELISATAVLASSGIKGSIAATGLKESLGRVTQITPKVTSGLRKLGLSQKDFVKESGEMKDIQEVFGMINKGAKGLTAVARKNLFEQIFGKRGKTAALILSRDIKQLDKIMSQVGGNDAIKNFEEINKFMGKSLQAKIKGVTSAFEFLTGKVFQKFSGKGGDVFEKLAEGLRNFDVTPIVNTLKIMFQILKGVWDIIGPFLPYILSLVVAIKAWAAAQTVINFLLTANPIGLIVVGIGTLIGLVHHLYTNWGKYALMMNLSLQETIAKWNYLKFTIMKVGAAIGLVSKQALSGAALDFQLSVIKGKSMALQAQQLSSGGKGTTGNVNVNVTGQKETTTVEQKGQMPAGSNLNVGLQ
jgi:hypothetical protein